MSNKSPKIKVIQTGSPIRRKAYQRKNLRGLGLSKINSSKILSDTPEVRGMINRVAHLVKVELVV